MIDRNQRVVFLAENQAGAAPWYQPAYKKITEETPYTFSKVAQLTEPAKLPASCKPNRGPAGAPLFLVNHWISTDPVPLPSNAAKVNAYEPLLARAQECQRLRKHLPEPDRGELLPRGRRVQGGRQAQRRALAVSWFALTRARAIRTALLSVSTS